MSLLKSCDSLKKKKNLKVAIKHSNKFFLKRPKVEENSYED